MNEEILELVAMAGLDTICEKAGVDPHAVIRLMIEEGLLDVRELLADTEEDRELSG